MPISEHQPNIVRSRAQEADFGTATLTEYSDGKVIFAISDLAGDCAHYHVLTDEEKANADWTLGSPVGE
jgi:hypothetical protein